MSHPEFLEAWRKLIPGHAWFTCCDCGQPVTDDYTPHNDCIPF